VTGVVLTAIVAIPCITLILILAMVLHFSRAMVEKTGGTACLRDVATLLRAFRAGPGGVISALSRIFRRG
jgi:hypothetical protein